MATAFHTTRSIADHVAGELAGPGDVAVTGLADLSRAEPGDLTFIGAARYAEGWATSQASAALINRDIDLQPGDDRALIRVDNADLAMAAVLELFAPPPAPPEPGIHPTAVVHPQAVLGQAVTIGPGCVIGAGAHIGDRCVLHPHVTVMAEAVVGPDSTLFPGVVLGRDCTIGHHAIIHSNAVIGADGFGYRPGKTAEGQPPIVKIPHLGAVQIGCHVEIGANTCIDRGKFDHTTVGDHTKLDNLVQIGHNCHIGNCVLIAGCTGIAGSVTIGDGTQIGGGARLKDHLAIGRGVQIAGAAAVIDDIPDGESWAGIPAKPIKSALREELAIRQLPDVLKQMRKASKQ